MKRSHQSQAVDGTKENFTGEIARYIRRPELTDSWCIEAMPQSPGGLLNFEACHLDVLRNSYSV